MELLDIASHTGVVNSRNSTTRPSDYECGSNYNRVTRYRIPLHISIVHFKASMTKLERRGYFPKWVRRMFGYGSSSRPTVTHPNVAPSDQNTIRDNVPGPNVERQPVADWLEGPVEGPDEEPWGTTIEKEGPIAEPHTEPPAYTDTSIAPVAEPLKEYPVSANILVEGGEGASAFSTPETPILGDELVKDLLAGGGTRRMDSLAPDKAKVIRLPNRLANSQATTVEGSVAPPTGLNKGVVRVAQGVAIGAAVLSLLIGGRQLYKWFTTRRNGKAKKLNAQSVNLENDEATRSRW
jgi:hypothetical protein